jgi:hypothetical protein
VLRTGRCGRRGARKRSCLRSQPRWLRRRRCLGGEWKRESWRGGWRLGCVGRRSCGPWLSTFEMWASVRWRRLVRRTRKIERDSMVVVVMQCRERVGGARGLDGNQGIWYGFFLSFNIPNLRSDMPISISSIHCSLINLKKPLLPPLRGLCISDHWNSYSFQCHLHRRQAGLFNQHTA